MLVWDVVFGVLGGLLALSSSPNSSSDTQVLKETEGSATAHNIMAQHAVAAPVDGDCAAPSIPVAAAPAAGPNKAGEGVGKKKGKGKRGRSKRRAR